MCPLLLVFGKAVRGGPLRFLQSLVVATPVLTFPANFIHGAPPHPLILFDFFSWGEGTRTLPDVLSEAERLEQSGSPVWIRTAFCPLNRADVMAGQLCAHGAETEADNNRL